MEENTWSFRWFGENRRMNVPNAKFGEESTNHPAMHYHLQTPQWIQRKHPPYPRDVLMLQHWQYCTCNLYSWTPFCVPIFFTKKPGVHRHYSNRRKKNNFSQQDSNHCPDCLPFCIENFWKFWQCEKNNAKEVFSGNFKAYSNHESYVWRRGLKAALRLAVLQFLGAVCADAVHVTSAVSCLSFSCCGFAMGDQNWMSGQA